MHSQVHWYQSLRNCRCSAVLFGFRCSKKPISTLLKLSDPGNVESELIFRPKKRLGIARTSITRETASIEVLNLVMRLNTCWQNNSIGSLYNYKNMKSHTRLYQSSLVDHARNDVKYVTSPGPAKSNIAVNSGEQDMQAPGVHCNGLLPQFSNNIFALTVPISFAKCCDPIMAIMMVEKCFLSRRHMGRGCCYHGIKVFR